MRKNLFVFLLVGILSSFVFAQPANNNFASATDVTALINAACTSGGAYTNIGATADQSKGSCWTNGPNKNVWFKFTATATTFINIKVKVNGAGETMRYPFVALWTGALAQVQCQNQQGAAVNLSMSYYGLTAGTTYYISVDTHSGGTYGTFDLCLSDVPDYDYPQGATDLTASINTACTTTGLYSTLLASADHSMGSCWTNGPNQNRWFKFTATATTFINVKVKVSGASETMRYPFVALWDSSLTQIACQNQQGAAVDLSLSYYGLTPGKTYYISVDTHSGGTYGTFDVCLSDVTDYDYPQGAIDLTASINAACTTTGLYSTLLATADHSMGSCWTNGPNQNRWFKFTATATTFINVKVKVSGASETMRYPFVALWDASLTQIACQNQQGAAVDLSLSYYGLTPGNTYYISVDTHSGGTYGTFDVCLSDVTDYDYPQGATDLTASINASCGSGGAYSTLLATPDHSKGSCWTNGPNQNRWFKFTATATTFINAQVKVSGAGETMRYPFVAIWDASLTQIACQNQQGSAVDLSLSYYGLTPGNTYYISVDTHSGGTYGTFDLCLSDQPDYDYPQGAIDLTGSINGSSAGGSFTTLLATPDHSKGSCWTNGPNQNRWFKFTATATTFINAQVKVSGAGETMRYPFVAIWDASLTQLACQNQQGSAVDLSVSYYGLTPGNTYYISVDTHSGGTYGTFDMSISDMPDYDYPQGAVDLTSSMNGCTSGGTYSTLLATSDHSKGSCWTNGPNQNRWFKFTASATTFINAQVLVSGSGETMRYPFVAIWDASFTQIACQNQIGSAVDLSLSYYGLTPGNTYYISVDTHSGGTYGTFDLCVTDQPDYDYPQGAVTLSNVNNFCSTGGAYTTLNATSDHSKGSCWTNGPNKNRWFKFQAIYSTTTIQVKVSGAGETMRYPFVALWASDFSTQLACTNQAGAAVDLTLNYASLVPGTWYYISVDTHSGGTYGTFDICINDASSVQYYSIGDGDWSNSANWSTTGFAGTTAGTTPALANVVNIQDHAITVSSTQNCAQINMTVSGANTSLTVDNSLLTVSGTYNQTNGGTNNSMITTVQNTGTLTINNNANFTRNGGNKDFQFNIGTGCLMNVGQDLLLTSTSGSAKDNLFTLNGTGSLVVSRDLTFNSSGGQPLTLTLNNSATTTVARDITFTASAAGQTQLALNNTSTLSIKRSFVRGATPYGLFSMASGATLIFNGTVTSQTMVGTAGSGTDAFNYTNVTFNNTGGSNPAVTLTGAATITGALTMTNGVVKTTAANLLTLSSTATSTSGTYASTSYITGPLAIQKNTAGSSTLNFPIGKTTESRPAVLTVNHTDGTLYNYTAEMFPSSASSLGYLLPATVDTVSNIRYWTITRTDGAGASQPSTGLSGNQTIQLYFGTNDFVYQGTKLTIIKNISAGTQWYDIGGSCSFAGNFSTPQAGYVTSTSTPNTFTSFSTFSLGSLLSGWNSLPISLLNFSATVNDKKTVDLNWTTQTEVNNNYFTIERSEDGQNFSEVLTENSKAPNGNSTQKLNYKTTDAHPLNGLSYYRLKQTDYNGKSKTFNTVSVSMDNGGVKLVAYPNPNNGTFTLDFSGVENRDVSIEIHDIYGKRIYSNTFYSTQPAGSLNILGDTKIGKGVYFCCLTVDGLKHTVKVIVE